MPWHYLRALLQPTRDRGLFLVWVGSATFALTVGSLIWQRPWLMDGATFWHLGQGPVAYHLSPNIPGAYLYSPVFAQVLTPLTWLPWPVFALLWPGFALAVYGWLVRPVGWVWGVPLLALALEDITVGNISWLLALTCVWGLRAPAMWAWGLLTKVTVAVGPLWFAVRREWRGLAWSVLPAGVLAGCSWGLTPDVWRAWVAFLAAHAGDGTTQFPLRLLCALVLVVFAARTDRRWLLPVAMLLATPVLMDYGMGLLCAIPRLLSPAQVARLCAPWGTPRAYLRRLLALPA